MFFSNQKYSYQNKIFFYCSKCIYSLLLLLLFNFQLSLSLKLIKSKNFLHQKQTLSPSNHQIDVVENIVHQRRSILDYDDGHFDDHNQLKNNNNYSIFDDDNYYDYFFTDNTTNYDESSSINHNEIIEFILNNSSFVHDKKMQLNSLFTQIQKRFQSKKSMLKMIMELITMIDDDNDHLIDGYRPISKRKKYNNNWSKELSKSFNHTINELIVNLQLSSQCLNSFSRIWNDLSLMVLSMMNNNNNNATNTWWFLEDNFNNNKFSWPLKCK